MKKRNFFPIYPVFLAPLVPLFILSLNIQQVNSLSGLRLIVVSIIFWGILFFIIGMVTRRNWSRAALITSIVIFLFNLLGFLVWWSALPVIILAIWLVWKGRPSNKFNFLANTVIIYSVVLLFIFIGWRVGERDWFFGKRPTQATTNNLPDIFLIILDSHTSHEVLNQRFGYDNGPFLNSLTSLGFQVGDCQSDSADTGYSLASMLNPNTATLPTGSEPWGIIHNSQVRNILEKRGYQTVAFATGFVQSEILNADVYHQPPMVNAGLNIYEYYYLKLTIAGSIMDEFYNLDERLSEIYRERTLLVLNHLPDASKMAGAQFVFAHILQPHPPFVFDIEGNPADWRKYSLPGNYNPVTREGYSVEGYGAGYVTEVQYVENAILPPIKTILAAQPDSIIILAGDHGPWYAETETESRATLCAVYGSNLSINPRAAFEEIIK